jgi:hypothetical protein
LKIPSQTDNLQIKKEDQRKANDSNQKELKRRGRKRERDDVYFVKGNKKINDLRDKLKLEGKGMTLTERQQIRNKISAQMSRLKKKEETIFLNRVVREKDDRYLKMAKSLCKVIDEA